VTLFSIDQPTQIRPPTTYSMPPKLLRESNPGMKYRKYIRSNAPANTSEQSLSTSCEDVCSNFKQEQAQKPSEYVPDRSANGKELGS
jgi:hypothetical protein